MNLSKHRTEASYAHSWGGGSSKAVKHKQYAINRYNRAIRRNKKADIRSRLND